MCMESTEFEDVLDVHTDIVAQQYTAFGAALMELWIKNTQQILSLAAATASVYIMQHLHSLEMSSRSIQSCSESSAVD